ncbi:2,4-dienoyl-CoA reductase-like NADH-dependent reductase (Old Yellow Enzyme family) [Lipingzhangella halophila]|uniref:2,4-dienoyl-CoA reductase-like NADH-dependent reductase (Old Yellow Enzyme family) n=1 Tax=Lipingzhangella halophila TaxID=1783352 RepID=A0A7W7RMB3_9ACTN|nr:NADH:flavin oxidoreductase/NADH oxidase family protein [Lipingzhangella halophila]MBB4934622.1 2,4-dienoyl-CoA reductase-like NADH-dependent reductase (Old Yellow Enzyme family) [Lipingzhangella halophila]
MDNVNIGGTFVTRLDAPLVLASGQALPNRIAKAAMEEFLAVDGQLPGHELAGLYRRWARGGAGLMITGHAMVDRRALADPSDVVLEEGTPLEAFRQWARAAQSGDGRVWLQVNHPGRVMTTDMPGAVRSASDVAVDVGRYSRLFPRPEPMTSEQIEETVQRFATTARMAESAGFDGVQIHAAHGYLISQFLSPLTNLRRDRWGGGLENRARLLLDIVAAVRAEVGERFAVGVKLNTADFQRGGFGADDASRVVAMLSEFPVDLVELSGGSLESLATHGHPADGSTLAREAYFLDAAEKIITDASVPIMLTGGIRRRSVAERVLAQGTSVVGMATALAVDPSLPRRWLHGEDAAAEVEPLRWRDKGLAAAAGQAALRCRLARLSREKASSGRTPPILALAGERLHRRAALRRYRRWLVDRRPPAPAG